MLDLFNHQFVRVVAKEIILCKKTITSLRSFGTESIYSFTDFALFVIAIYFTA